MDKLHNTTKPISGARLPRDVTGDYRPDNQEGPIRMPETELQPTNVGYHPGQYNNPYPNAGRNLGLQPGQMRRAPMYRPQ